MLGMACTYHHRRRREHNSALSSDIYYRYLQTHICTKQMHMQCIYMHATKVLHRPTQPVRCSSQPVNAISVPCISTAPTTTSPTYLRTIPNYLSTQKLPSAPTQPSPPPRNQTMLSPVPAGGPAMLAKSATQAAFRFPQTSRPPR